VSRVFERNFMTIFLFLVLSALLSLSVGCDNGTSNNTYPESGHGTVNL